MGRQKDKELRWQIEAGRDDSSLRVYDRAERRYRGFDEVADRLQARLLGRSAGADDSCSELISDEELAYLEEQAETVPQYWNLAVAQHFREGGPVTEELVEDLRYLAETTGVPWRASRGGHGG